MNAGPTQPYGEAHDQNRRFFQTQPGLGEDPRYYDEVGLLAPVETDRSSGYRYYSLEQPPRLNRILALKDLGFSLEQIAQALENGITLEQLRGMLRLKQAQQQRVQDEQERLVRVEARLRQIEMEASVSKYEVVIKRLDPVKVASVRRVDDRRWTTDHRP